MLREEWRVVDRWWTEEPVHRRYFDLVLESGENAVVYHDDDAGNNDHNAAADDDDHDPQHNHDYDQKAL